MITEEPTKSRTIHVSDKDWAEVQQAAIEMGFGGRGRGRAIVKLAKDHNETVAAANKFVDDMNAADGS